MAQKLQKAFCFPGNAFSSVNLKLSTCKQDVWRENLNFITTLACSLRCRELFNCDQNLNVTNEKINPVPTIPL